VSKQRRLGTDALGRAVYECADCGSALGAPYTQHTDGMVRCSPCTVKHDTRTVETPEQAYARGVADGRRKAYERSIDICAEAGLAHTAAQIREIARAEEDK
jgi:DNA-directed RNA polymerase subunit RPC12/RpoP